MKRICFTTCLVLLTSNLIDAFQRVKPERYPNYGQDEPYFPSYLKTYQPSSSLPYGYNLQNNEQQQQIDPRQDSFDPFESEFRFASLNNPSILLNGQDQLSKYKNYKHRQVQFRPTHEDLNKLLVSIQNIKPSNDGNPTDFIQKIEDNGAEKLDQNGNFNKYHALYKPPSDNLNYGYINSDLSHDGKLERYPNSQPVYREENMEIPYDEIEEQKKQLQLSKNVVPNKSMNELGTKHVPAKSMNELGIKHAPALVLKSQHMIRAPKAYQQPINSNIHMESRFSNLSDIYFIVIVACVSTVAIFSVIGAGYCFYKVQQSNKAAADVDFPAYGVIGPVSRDEGNKCTSPSNDRKLVQSAQIYHYHHQKQQMISTEKSSNLPKNNAGSDIESDEENEDGEYTVYECPGLAPTGEMEIKNPLFQDDLTPMSSPSVNGSVVTSKGTSPKISEAKNGKTE